MMKDRVRELTNKAEEANKDESLLQNLELLLQQETEALATIVNYARVSAVQISHLAGRS